MQLKSEKARRQQVEDLQPGESTVFFPNPGQTVQRLQATVAALVSTHGVKNLVEQEYSQRKALIVMEGQMPIPVTILTRAE